MEKLTSILVVVDPADGTRHVIAKAMVLARHFGARIELFMCDSEQAYAFRHSYDVTGINEARRVCLANGQTYLDAIRRSVAEDVAISTHVACESPLYEAIVHRVQQSQPDLVIKSAAGHRPLRRFTLDTNDWQLARTCPVPLMLTRGRPWNARPHFVAAVDVADPQGEALARSILQTAGHFASGCRAELDVVFSDRADGDATKHATRLESLRSLVREFRVGGEHLQVLEGEAEVTLPAFAAQRDFDVMVLGALTRRRGLSGLVGTLTSRLVDILECDFVLVKSDSYASPVEKQVQEATA